MDTLIKSVSQSVIHFTTFFMSYIPAHIFNPNDFYLCFSDSSDDEDLLSSAWDHTKDAQVVKNCKTCHF